MIPEPMILELAADRSYIKTTSIGYSCKSLRTAWVLYINVNTEFGIERAYWDHRINHRYWLVGDPVTVSSYKDLKTLMPDAKASLKDPDQVILYDNLYNLWKKQ